MILTHRVQGLGKIDVYEIQEGSYCATYWKDSAGVWHVVACTYDRWASDTTIMSEPADGILSAQLRAIEMLEEQKR